MAFSAKFEQSNKADWFIDLSATNAETGDAIDFTGASVLFTVKDRYGCQQLSASTTAGTITLVSTTVLEIHFTAAQMEALCPDTYAIGCVFQLNGEIDQLLTGTVSVYDGVSQI